MKETASPVAAANTIYSEMEAPGFGSGRSLRRSIVLAPTDGQRSNLSTTNVLLGPRITNKSQYLTNCCMYPAGAGAAAAQISTNLTKKRKETKKKQTRRDSIRALA